MKWSCINLIVLSLSSKFNTQYTEPMQKKYTAKIYYI